MYKVLKTGSKGNSVLYGNCVLVDIGVPFSLLEPYLKRIQLVLLTHKHNDHINQTTLKRLVLERPTVRIGVCEWMLDYVKEYKNVDVFEIPKKKGDRAKLYNYGSVKISPIKLYHDVQNCGYRLFFDNYKIIHATDTQHLKGITAKGYDLYAIEHNYNEDTVWDTIERIEKAGGYAHQKGSIETHLSEQQAREFIHKNAVGNYEVLRLHETQSEL